MDDVDYALDQLHANVDAHDRWHFVLAVVGCLLFGAALGTLAAWLVP